MGDAFALVDPSGKSWVDRRGMKRIRPMEVLVLGLPRTGTNSMMTALQMLDYGTVYHMAAAIANPPDFDLWLEATRANFFPSTSSSPRWTTAAQFDQMLGHCGATTDFPPALFAADLVAAYPAAKVVLTTRAFAPWYASMQRTIGKALDNRALKLLAHFDRAFAGRVQATIPLMWLAAAGAPVIEPESARRLWEEHNALVRRIVPKERLLEFEAGKKGGDWETLCRFLGKEVPPGQDPKKFPHTNDKENFAKSMEAMVMASAKRAAWNIAMVVLPVAVVGVGIWFARSRGSL